MKEYIGRIISPYEPDKQIEFVKLTVSDVELNIEFPSKNMMNYSNLSTIKGVFNGLGNVTLINCKNIGTSIGSGAKIKKYSAEYILTNICIQEPKEINFKKVYVEVTGLLDWTNISSVTMNENGYLINKPDNIKIYESELFNVDLFSTYRTNHQRPNNQITIKENMGFVIIPKNKMSFWKFIDYIKEIQKLFYIINNRNSEIDSIVFTCEQKDRYKLFWKNQFFNGNVSPLKPKFEYKIIKSELSKIFNVWFNNSDIHTSIDLILEKASNNNLSKENYFLNNCFSIETYHRRFKNYKLFGKDEFREMKKSILSVIKQEKLKTLVGNNLAHINEPNFKSRLDDFISDFEKVLPNIWDSKEYIRRIVKTRNYLVHRSSNKHIFEGIDLLYSAIFIETITTINIYRTFGIKKELIDDVLVKTGERIIGFYDLNKKLSFDKIDEN